MNSGVYQIRNFVNGKLYIGSSNDFIRRWKDHRNCLRKGSSKSPRLQRAWLKYGESSFGFSVILRCDQSRMLLHEQCAIDALRPSYNTAPIVGSGMGGRHHSEESRLKISRARMGRKVTPETLEKMRLVATGKKASLASRIKCSESMRGKRNNLGNKASYETRLKMSQSLKEQYLSGKRSRIQPIRHRNAKGQIVSNTAPEVTT